MQSKRQKRHQRNRSRRDRFRKRYGIEEAADLSAAFARAEARPAGHERALRAARRTSYPLHTSHWLEGGVQRAMHASGLSALDAVELLDAFLRWSYAGERVLQADVAIQLANLELLRRKHGAPAATVVLPDPLPGDDLTPKEVRELVMEWEGLAYGTCLLEKEDDEVTAEELASSAYLLVRHLAEADMLPVRLDRLDPAALAVELQSHRDDPALPALVPEFEPSVLGNVAVLYERSAARDILPDTTARRLARDLRALSMAYAEPRSAA